MVGENSSLKASAYAEVVGVAVFLLFYTRRFRSRSSAISAVGLLGHAGTPIALAAWWRDCLREAEKVSIALIPAMVIFEALAALDDLNGAALYEAFPLAITIF